MIPVADHHGQNSENLRIKMQSLAAQDVQTFSTTSRQKDQNAIAQPQL